MAKASLDIFRVYSIIPGSSVTDEMGREVIRTVLCSTQYAVGGLHFKADTRRDTGSVFCRFGLKGLKWGAHWIG